MTPTIISIVAITSTRTAHTNTLRAASTTPSVVPLKKGVSLTVVVLWDIGVGAFVRDVRVALTVETAGDGGIVDGFGVVLEVILAVLEIMLLEPVDVLAGSVAVFSALVVELEMAGVTITEVALVTIGVVVVVVLVAVVVLVEVVVIGVVVVVVVVVVVGVVVVLLVVVVVVVIFVEVVVVVLVVVVEVVVVVVEVGAAVVVVVVMVLMVVVGVVVVLVVVVVVLGVRDEG